MSCCPGWDQILLLYLVKVGSTDLCFSGSSCMIPDSFEGRGAGTFEHRILRGGLGQIFFDHSWPLAELTFFSLRWRVGMGCPRELALSFFSRILISSAAAIVDVSSALELGNSTELPNIWQS